MDKQHDTSYNKGRKRMPKPVKKRVFHMTTLANQANGQAMYNLFTMSKPKEQSSVKKEDRPSLLKVRSVKVSALERYLEDKNGL